MNTNYFENHNRKRSDFIKRLNQAEKIEYTKRVKEDIRTNEIIKNRKKDREQYLKDRFSGKRKNTIFSIQLNKYIPYEEYLKKGTNFINKEEVLGEEQAERMMGN